jgi:hypothetical protein
MHGVRIRRQVPCLSKKDNMQGQAEAMQWPLFPPRRERARTEPHEKMADLQADHQQVSSRRVLSHRSCGTTPLSYDLIQVVVRALATS